MFLYSGLYVSGMAFRFTGWPHPRQGSAFSGLAGQGSTQYGMISKIRGRFYPRC